MKKILLCLLCMIALCGCSQNKSSSQSTKKETEEIIEYKDNVVFLKNGQTLKVKEKIKNINDYIDDYDTLETESSAVFYSNDDIEIFIGMDQKVKKITLLTDKYSIDNGIKIGSLETEVEENYNEYSKEIISDQNNTLIECFNVDGVNVTFTSTNQKISKIELEVDSYS